MYKTKYIVFDNDSVKFVTNQNVNDLKGIVVENPDMQFVHGVPPHYWKITEDHKIHPMNKDEMKKRDKLIKDRLKSERRRRVMSVYWPHIYSFCFGCLFSFILIVTLKIVKGIQ